MTSVLFFDYSALKERITEVCGTQQEFAKRMSLSTRTVSLKMTSKIGWKQEEIKKACGILGLSSNDIPAYFFKLRE